MSRKFKFLPTLLLCAGLLALPFAAAAQQDHSGHQQASDSQPGHNHDEQSGMMNHGDGQGGMMNHGDGQGGMMNHGGGQGGMMNHGGGQGGMMNHSGGQGMSGMGSQQATGSATSGQSAMDVLSQVISTLQADPDTDWSRINISALHQHLVDMDRVALYAEAEASEIDGGSEYRITGPDQRTVAAIQRMVPTHALQIERELGWDISTRSRGNTLVLAVSSPDGSDTDMIRALGFAGFMVLGEHHADHHLMMAGALSESATESMDHNSADHQDHSGH